MAEYIRSARVSLLVVVDDGGRIFVAETKQGEGSILIAEVTIIVKTSKACRCNAISPRAKQSQMQLRDRNVRVLSPAPGAMEEVSPSVLPMAAGRVG